MFAAKIAGDAGLALRSSPCRRIKFTHLDVLGWNKKYRATAVCRRSSTVIVDSDRKRATGRTGGSL
jgi:hypothetical protein